MADPVAWTMIESGWKVFDAEGEEIGTVHEVTGDENVDIFDGLAIKQGTLSGEQYVPSENVGQILMGEVHLSLTRSEVEALGTFTEPPPEEQIIPEKSTWYQRFAWKWLTGRKR
jgi:sporulation protein YlmC with PRC-barrel domain